MSHGRAVRWPAGIRRQPPSPVLSAGAQSMSDRAVLGWLALIAVSVAVVSTLESRPAPPKWVFALIVASVVLAEMVPVKVGRIRYVGSDFAIWLAVAILGAWPALLIAAAGMTVDATLRRVPLRLMICNQAVFTFVVAAGASLFAGLREIGFAVPGEPGLPLAVLLLAWTTDSLNLVLLAVGSPLMRGERVRDALRDHLLPVLPWMTVTAGVAAGAVHAYYTLGPGALAVAVLLHGIAQGLLKTIEREERQRADVHAAFAARDRSLADALEAEARERRRVALELHDDALQNLVMARQDIAAGEARRADEHLAAAIDGVRRLAARQYDAESGRPDLAGRLQELLDVVAAQGAMAHSLEVRVAQPDPATQELVIALVRELAVNATKHSGGSRIDVLVAPEGDVLVLSVGDDGRGFGARSSHARLREGHLGLAVAQDRVTARGGSLDVSRSEQGGACVTARIPLAG